MQRKGVNKFDGIRFSLTIKVLPGKPEHPGNELNYLLDDPVDSVLWIATQRAGLNAYNYGNMPLRLINMIRKIRTA